MTSNTAPNTGLAAPAAKSQPGEVLEGTTNSSQRAAVRTSLLAALFAGLFGIMLGSFPARNADLWKHLSDGRDLASGVGDFGPTWLYDLASYTLFMFGGGSALAAAKALLCGVVALLMLRLSSTVNGWRIPLVVTGLATLAMANRMLLQPATVSVLFLAICFWLLHRDGARAPDARIWPGWRLVVLFVLWPNVESRFVLGLGLVALTWLGEVLDARSAGGIGRALTQRAWAICILVCAACLSPMHVKGLAVPPELRTGFALREPGSTTFQVGNSPFERAYFEIFREIPSALAYYPLLLLGLVSIALNWKEWRWARFLPWTALVVVSGLQVRMVPFFAVIAGPVTAWNLQAYFGRRETSLPVRSSLRYAGLLLTFFLAAAFLVSAWPGWLQGPPFEPRRWVVEVPAALPRGVEFLQRAHASGLWPADTRTLHVSSDTAGMFAWFCPEDHRFRDDDVVDQLLNPDESEAARQRLRALGVSRVLVYAGDSSASSRAILDLLLTYPEEWPVLHLKGGLVVFGWRDPAQPRGADGLKDWEIDFARLAFRPDESEVAPSSRLSGKRLWSDAFWKPAHPPRSMGRDEATVLLRKAEAMQRTAPFRQQVAWEAGQVTGLVGAAAGWIGNSWLLDPTLRLALLRPPVPDKGPLPAITQLTYSFEHQFAVERGQTPVGILYAAIRAARRAIAENPDDANSNLTLGRAYVALVETTSERSWVNLLPQLIRVRQIQASAALNRALVLNPKLAQAHFELGELYLTLECLDLAALHLREYLNSPPHWGGPVKGDRRAEAAASKLERLTKALDRHTQEYLKESERSSVSDRAIKAARRGLGGQARDLLLKSDVAAFGAEGMELELDLLLRTGRPADVLEWTTPEVRGPLRDLSYHWLRSQALIALGDYNEANTELTILVGPGGRMPESAAVGKEISTLVGKALLDEQIGGSYLPQLVKLALNRSDFRTRLSEITHRLVLAAEVTLLRGLIALESGNIDRAREAFRVALTFSPNRWGNGQLEFNSRRIAWDCLTLIEGRAGP